MKYFQAPVVTKPVRKACKDRSVISILNAMPREMRWYAPRTKNISVLKNYIGTFPKPMQVELYNNLRG